MGKNRSDDRQVHVWELLIALVQLATAIVNAVFNYPSVHAR